ncbi:SDR family NAD(P)-dependent oxidoreductase [Paraburkholderia sp. MMS20-SJTR3]|uniref:SDR family NAD(P)-dependent oxidoreductase n=1 Tax=Paraburkholderia sejongensis TaxID=2886946 RepID=A0ABS8K1L0_9BURK|nr:SDR family NAD(P)-dependent oxidoreductase [Paraburkholderia sp. MMS20-SJTR3]MCC8395818.1 SDR family NAD(P)-dependent oxidoreductase [Paraburkholderia sp. MMS20-SJTR3]
MQIEGCVAFVTGADRGLGAGLLEKLLERGARKVYAGVRKKGGLADGDPRVVPVEIDITNVEQVTRAASNAKDLTLLINNAGLNRTQPVLETNDAEAARAEMEVNYFGTLNMMRAFSPALKTNGGAIINILSILARVALPAMASLSASKAAALRMTEGARAELAPHRVRVISVLPGPIDTEMSRDVPPPKIPVAEAVDAVLAALEGEQDEVYMGAMAQEIAHGLAADRQALHARLLTL